MQHATHGVARPLLHTQLQEARVDAAVARIPGLAAGGCSYLSMRNDSHFHQVSPAQQAPSVLGSCALTSAAVCVDECVRIGCCRWMRSSAPCRRRSNCISTKLSLFSARSRSPSQSAPRRHAARQLRPGREYSSTPFLPPDSSPLPPFLWPSGSGPGVLVRATTKYLSMVPQWRITARVAACSRRWRLGC